jgi:hypothetical protein
MTFACIGGGPSLTQADVDRLRGRCSVIAINDAYRLAPWADVLYAADYKWWEYHRGAPDFTGLKCSIESSIGLYWPGVTVLRNTGPDGLETDPTGLRAGKNGGYQAINLAVHLGATRILLLGYDMSLSADGRSHWFGEHPPTVRDYSPYDEMREAFESLKAPLANAGVEVLNCSRRSALTAFPIVALDEALGAITEVAR